MLLIGAGRVGGALQAAAERAGVQSALIDRDSGWELLEGPAGTPVVLCVRNDALDPVLERIPRERRADLVFVQNGALRDFLSERGLSDCTRGLLYFAVAKAGDPIDPGRISWFTGPHAAAMVGFVEACGVRARALGPAEFANKEVEKLAWLAVFGPLCDRAECTVGQAVEQFPHAIRNLAAEVLAVAGPAWGADLGLDALVDALCDYSLSIPEFRAAVKEWPWRNGWLFDESDRSGVQMPEMRALLR